MSRPTVTRQQLRRMICIELGMPFAMRFVHGELFPTGTGTQTTIRDTKLVQPTDFWNRSWAFVRQSSVSLNNAISLIRDFSAGMLLLESALGFETSQTTPYEIHSIFNAIEIHQAINRAIQDSHPAFYEEREDSSLVLVEDRLEYDLSALSHPAESISSVAIEQPTSKILGVVGSFNSAPVTSTVTDTSLNLSNVNNRWLISFYGNLNGQRGIWCNVTGVNNTTKVISFSTPSFSYTFANGMKFMLWNPEHQGHIWHQIRLLSFDRKEWPGILRFHENHSAHGHRIKIRHATVPIALSTEIDTTIVPQEFIIPKAISFLAASRINDNRVDRQKYAVIAQQKAQEAEIYRRSNFFRRSDIPLWMEGGDSEISDVSSGSSPFS